jgi:hypothetical protein
MHDVLSGLQRQIMIVDELIHNDVSSTKVRYPLYPLGLLRDWETGDTIDLIVCMTGETS